MKKIFEQLQLSLKRTKVQWVDKLVGSFVDVRTPVMGMPKIKAVQTDATLDPGATPAYGDAYILTDVNTLHTNFVTVDSVANDDVVYWDGKVFAVAISAVAATATGVVLNTFNEDTGTVYVFTGGAWVELGAGGLVNPIAGEDGVAYDMTLGQIAANDLFSGAVKPFIQNNVHAEIKNVIGVISAFGATGLSAVSVMDYASSESGISTFGLVRDNSGVPEFDCVIRFQHDGTTHLDSGVIIVGGYSFVTYSNDGADLTTDHIGEFHKFGNIPTYVDNAAAVAGSHPLGAMYQTATGELRIVV